MRRPYTSICRDAFYQPQTCASLAVNGRSRRGRAVPVLHHDGGGRLGAAVAVQGCSHLGGGAAPRGAQAAVMAASRSGRVRNQWSCGAVGGRGLCWGSVVTVVGSRSRVRWRLLVVLGVRRRRRSRGGEAGVGRSGTRGSVVGGGCYIVLQEVLLMLLMVVAMVIISTVHQRCLVGSRGWDGGVASRRRVHGPVPLGGTCENGHDVWKLQS